MIRRVDISDDAEIVALCGGPYSNFAAMEAFLAATTAFPDRVNERHITARYASPSEPILPFTTGHHARDASAAQGH